MERLKTTLSRKSDTGGEKTDSQKRYKSGSSQAAGLHAQSSDTVSAVSAHKLGGGALEALPQHMKQLKLKDERQENKELVFDGKVTDGDPNTCGHVITTTAGSGSNKQTLTYHTQRVVGNGSFGVVFQATCVETGDTVAIKKVLQDKRFKNRELQIMKMMSHTNVVQLKHCFYTSTEKDEVYLNLVLEYVPETVYRIGKHYSKAGQHVPSLFIKLYVYQAYVMGFSMKRH